MAARYCKWPEMADAIEALLDDGVDLDFSRNVPKDTVIVFENIQTTREAIHDNCPEIL
jgi:hypothetical protein